MAFFAVSVVVRLLLAALLVFIAAKGIRETGTEGWLVLPAVIPMGAALFENELIVFHLMGVWHFRGVTIVFVEAAEMVMAAAVGLLMLLRMLQSVRRQRRWPRGRFAWWPESSSPAKRLEAYEAQLLMVAGDVSRVRAAPMWWRVSELK